MYYLIRETLENGEAEEILTAGIPYVAVLTRAEWQQEKERLTSA